MPRSGRGNGSGSSEQRDAVVYAESARTYRSTVVLAAALLAGFALDLSFGGAGTHALAWTLAIVLVTGADALSVYAARSVRSLAVTEREIRVGDDSLERSRVRAVGGDVDDHAAPILGRDPGEGLPRGSAGLTLLLDDGERIVVPTRRPDLLAAALQVGAPEPVVRAIAPQEYHVVQEILDRAKAIFEVAGYELLDMGYPERELQDAMAIFVIGAPPYGFISLGEVDGMASIGGLALIPGAMRKGAGTALLEAAYTWARSQGYRAIVVTAFSEVPWHAPFYAARGFTVVDELTPDLAELRDWERAAGLDALGPRVAMRRDL